MRVPKRAVALESLAKAIRHSTDTLISFDAFERWGPTDDDEQLSKMQRAADEATESRKAAIDALALRLPKLLEEEPAIVDAWVDAHLALLDELLAREKDTTALYVAKEEKTKWRQVRRGEITHVEQNTFHVRYDRALYEQTFGFLY